jgi:chemosensory pili system protein ChpA (sensor histidine kinase/response regulator)
MTPIPDDLPPERGAGSDHNDEAPFARGDSSLDTDAEDAQGQSPTSRQTILLVEDDSSLADPWSDSLRFAGYECVIARDVAAALAILVDEARQVAVMVADLNLAGSDGAALIRTARGMSRYSALPVIIISGDGSPRAQERARLAGMNTYLVKPIATSTLLQAIARWTRAKLG